MKNEGLQRALRFAQWIALTFILVLGTLMAHDAVQADSILRAGQTRLDSLKAGNLDDPALAQTVRDLDYLYRATYFQTRDRQSYGFLLLGSAFLILCALLVLDCVRFAPDLKIPNTYRPSAESERKELLRFAVSAIAVLIAVLVGLRVTWFSTPGTHQSSPETTAEADTQRPSPAGETIILSQALEEATQQWPQFRGSLLPNRNALPRTWKFTPKWQTPIPLSGFNSPVVWDDRIFVAGGDKTERAVFCYNAGDGKQRWKVASTATVAYPDVSEDTGISAPTLCVDKARVYAIFATGEMLCCDHDGTTVWRRQLPTPEIMYGYASSPLLLGDRLIIQYDLEKTQTIYAINVLTGNDLWKTERQTTSSWSSPIAYIDTTKSILFVVGNQAAEGIDAQTGRVIWSNACLGGEVATSGIVYRNAFCFANSGAITASFRVDDGTILMKNETTPAPDVASPVVVGNTLFLFTSGASVLAIDAETGKELYEKEFDNGFYASPVVIGGKIIAVNLDGDLFLLTPSATSLDIDGKYAIGSKVVSVPAFHKGNIIIRTAANTLVYLESTP